MDREEIIDSIKTLRQYGTETRLIEAKSAKGGFPKCWDTISSFSNKYGGIIIFGLSEDKDFKAEGVYDVGDLQKKLAEVGKNSMTPQVHMDIVPFEFEGAKMVAAKVYELPQNEKPCYKTQEGISRGSYTRIGECDERMTPYEIYALQSYAEGVHEDLRQIKQASLDDLNADELSKYVQKVKSEKPRFSRNADDKILKLSGIQADSMPTLAGLLVFGEYPQAYCPQLFVACSAMPGRELGETGKNGQRFNDNQRVDGTIEEMLTGTLNFLRRNMKTMVIIDENGRRTDVPEYPLLALREAVANALVHRDYSRHTENAYIQVYMFSDRIEIMNPGALYGQNRIEKLGTDTMMETRNPNIVRLLEEKDPAAGNDSIKTLENRHTGIPTMRLEMKKYGLPEPEFIEEQGAFKVIFRNSVSNLKPNDTVSDTVNDTVSDTVKNDKVAAILTFCAEPRSATEIAKKIGITSKTYAIRRYITPLVSSGKLRRTVPDKPNSRNQRYIKAK